MNRGQKDIEVSQDSANAPDQVPDVSREDSVITLRSVVAGAVCVAIVCVLVTWAELVVMSIRIGYLQLPPVSIGLLALLIAATAIARKVFGQRFAFTKTELAVV